MKHSKSAVRYKFSCLAQLRFDDQQLTSFSGLIIFQQLFSDLELRRKISRCFEHRTCSPIFSTSSIMLLLIVNVLLGYRRLRDVQYFNDDPIVLRVLGVRRMPAMSTISRQLEAIDDRSVDAIERVQQTLVIDALSREALPRVTLDFDGSILGTCRRAEGVAIGFNRKKKGQRSHYPLYCTVAQTAEVLAVHHPWPASCRCATPRVNAIRTIAAPHYGSSIRSARFASRLFSEPEGSYVLRVCLHSQ